MFPGVQKPMELYEIQISKIILLYYNRNCVVNEVKNNWSQNLNKYLRVLLIRDKYSVNYRRYRRIKEFFNFYLWHRIATFYKKCSVIEFVIRTDADSCLIVLVLEVLMMYGAFWYLLAFLLSKELIDYVDRV